MISWADYHLLPLLWVALSVLLYLAGVHLSAILERGGRSQRIAWEVHRPPLRYLFQAGYFLGVPYWALLQGALLPRLLGLADLNWPQDVGAGLSWGLIALALTWLIFWYVRGRERSDVLFRRPATITLLWNAVLFQTHWCFYRAALSQTLNDVYWGAFASLIPLALETVLHPSLRRWLGQARFSPYFIMSRLAILGVTTVLYLYMRNWLLLIFMHWLGEIVLAALFTSRSPVESG